MGSTSKRRAFAPAWLGGEAAARRLLRGGFDETASRIEAARLASARTAAPELVDELARQHAALPASPARERALRRLLQGGAAAVVSGQQVGLFTGPAFSLYKAAGVVAAAQALEAESGVPCVGVFWLQTEDHDWPEIDHCFVRRGDGKPQRIDVAAAEATERCPVSGRRYGAGIETSLAQLEAATSAQPHATESVAMLRRHYVRGASPAEAFRGVLGELFCDDGLLFFDPRSAPVAALTSSLFERCLVDAAPLSELLEQRSAEIEAAGFEVQVRVRPGSPLCFFHPDGDGGARWRLEPEGSDWRLCGSAGTATRQSVLERVAADPLAASSSALLRPLLQDFLFPTAVYLAGPGEIAYFAQLPPLYEAFGMEMPLVAPRPSFVVTEAADRRRLEALALRPHELSQDRKALLSRLAAGTAGQRGLDAAVDRQIETSLTAGFLERLDEFSRHALEVDPALAGQIEKTRSSVLHSASRLAERYRRSVVARDSVTAGRLDALRDALAPNGVPQERCYGLASLAARHGAAALVAALAARIVPFDGATREIAL